MKILPIYTEALRGFGYTEEEARFLYLVATHSGYFTCQQFLQFIKTRPGKRSVTFARKVVEKKHATTKDYLGNGRVFHLYSRNVYKAIGRENVRFRRVHSTGYIRTRLIAFDFILRNQSFSYLESENEKVCFFCERMGIAKPSYNVWLPLDANLADILRRHREKMPDALLGTGWVFVSPFTGKPWWAHKLVRYHLRPAAEKAKIGRIGWHTFRHTYSTLLHAYGTDMKVQQELLRHSDIRTTMNIYTHTVSPALREANSKVVRMILPEEKTA